MSEQIWSLSRGDGPVVATAIHDGHDLRPEVYHNMALDDGERLREEDPYTGSWTEVAPTRLVALRSRFELDLNRSRESAVYQSPADAWGLHVWREELRPEIIADSLANYDAFYGALYDLYQDLIERHGRILVLDLHAYNHRRQGQDEPPAEEAGNPQINLGTGTMVDRGRWADIIEAFAQGVASYDFPGGGLDVRENIRFRGGHCARWTHARFPESACVLSVEVKKFFMDEWSGRVDPVLHEAVGQALRAGLLSVDGLV